MAKLEIYECDKCGKRGESKDMFHDNFAIGTEYNGVETVTINEEIDLCPTCAYMALGNFLYKLSYEDRIRWLKAHGKNLK